MVCVLMIVSILCGWWCSVVVIGDFLVLFCLWIFLKLGDFGIFVWMN